MNCPGCQAENREGRRFCGKCGASLALTCSACGFSNEPGENFCGGCGQSLAVANPAPLSDSVSPETYTPKHLAEKILTSKSSLEGERKQVTVLFADLKGSMELLADRDPEESRTLLNAVVERMMEAVHRYEGTVNNVMGDGIMATFGAPLAHEDHAMRGCYAALRMQDAVNRFSDEAQQTGSVPVTIRVGLNSGEVVVGSVGDDLRMDYTAVGQTTHLAARMEQMAKPGTIMVSNETHKLTEGFFQYKSLGRLPVKGVSEPVDVYELTGVGPLRTRLDVAARRGLVRFVGRQTEMEQMRRAIDLAKEGHGQIVGVIGEAGVGKSRLCYEFKVIEQTGWLVLEAFSVSHGKAYPYLPLTDLLKSYFQIDPNDDERTRREKLGGKVLMLDRSLEDALPYLLFLLGISEPGTPLQQMDSQIRRQRTLDAIKRLLLRESQNQPLLLLFEDLHWIDGETQAFLDILSEGLASARILLLVNYRPEYRHSWGSKTYYTQLRLDPLGRADAGELLDAMLGEDVGLVPLKEKILEKTEGYPFYMEEVVRTLIEEEVLVGERGNYELANVSSELHIPPTVQVALASRIDRLMTEDKGLLQALAVVGRKFTLSLLKEVVDTPESELYGPLSRLQAGEFVYEQPAFPEVEYSFKHALTQDVAYNSVLSDRRRLIHERTGQAIEGLYRDRLDEHYGELAHHYRHGETIEKAVDYLRLAGQQAVQRSANEEAVNHLTAAIELLKNLPDTLARNQQELTLQVALGVPLASTKGQTSPDAQKAYTRAQDLSQQVGEAPKLLPALVGLCRGHLLRAELEMAHKLGEQILSLARKVEEPAGLVEAYRLLGATSFAWGELASSKAYFEQAIAVHDPQKDSSHFALYGHNPEVYCLSFMAHSVSLLGYPDRALEGAETALALARDGSYAFGLGFALELSCRLRQYRGDLQAAREQAEAIVTLANEGGFRLWSAWGTNLWGWVLAEEALSSGEQDQVEEGITQMRKGLIESQALGVWFWGPCSLALLAQVYGKAGQTENALNTVAEALDSVNRTGERWYEAELHRLRGELLLQSEVQSLESKVRQAEAGFRHAIDVARSQQAKSLELRAVTSLGRLLHQQGKTEEARQMLAEIYGWFTEGFDTDDLKEAKALLDELI